MNALCHRMDLAARFHEAKAEFHTAKLIRKQVDVFKRIEQGAPYLATTFYVPGELLEMFDVQAIYIERTAGFAAATKIIPYPVQQGLGLGFPECGCSYQAMFDLLVKRGFLPEPHGFIASNFACDDAWMYCQTAAARCKVPFDFIDVTGEPGEASIRYLACQLESLGENLELRFKRKSTMDEIVKRSNEAMNIKLWIDDMRVKYPGIISSIIGLKLFTLYNDLGSSAALEILQCLKEEVESRIPGYRSENKPRLLWLGIIPLYRNSLISDIEQKYGCRIVLEELFKYTRQQLSCENLYYDLARRIASTVFFSMENRLSFILKHIEAMNVDGVIHFSQRNCRFLPPMVPVLRSRLKKKGIPFVEIQGDAVDPSCFDESRCWNQLDVFFEMVDRRYNLCI